MIDQMGRVLFFRAQDRTVFVEARCDGAKPQSAVFSLESDRVRMGNWFHLLHDDSKEAWEKVENDITLGKAERELRPRPPPEECHWPTQRSARLDLKTLSILVALGAAQRAKSEVRIVDVGTWDLGITGWTRANQIPTSVRNWLPDRPRNKTRAWLAECRNQRADGKEPDPLLYARLVDTEARFDPDLSPRDADDVLPAAFRWLTRCAVAPDHGNGVPAGAPRKRSGASPALPFVSAEVLRRARRHSVLLPSSADFANVTPDHTRSLAQAAAAVFEAHELRRKPQAADTRDGPRAKLALALMHTARTQDEGPLVGEATDLAELVQTASRQRAPILAAAARGRVSSVELGVHLLIGTELALLYRYDFDFSADSAIIAETAGLLSLDAERYAAWAQWRVKEVLLASAAWSNRQDLFTRWFPEPPDKWVEPMIDALVRSAQAIGKAQSGVLFTDAERSEVEYRVRLAAGVVSAAFPRDGVDPVTYFDRCEALLGREALHRVLDVYRAMATTSKEDRNKWVERACAQGVQTPGFFQHVAAYLRDNPELRGWQAITTALQKAATTRG